MSVIRPKPPEDPIAYDPRAALGAAGTSCAGLESLAAGLERARRDLLATAAVAVPERLLADYTTAGRRASSELFAILRTARGLGDAVDRVVVVGAGCGLPAARAVFDSCAHPHHNELPRGERGGRPRLSFIDASADNDSYQGLIDLVAPAGGRPGRDLLDRWAVIVTGTAEAAVGSALAARLFLDPLRSSLGGDEPLLADRILTVTGAAGPLAELASRLGCRTAFTVPDAWGEDVAAWTAAGLLPAATAGIDVVRLLQGAVAMNRRFREATVEANPILQYAAVSLLAAAAGRGVRLDSASGRQLGGVGLWYDCLRSCRRAGPPSGAGPAGPPLVTEILVGEPRSDRLVVPPLSGVAPAGGPVSPVDAFSGTPWPEVVAAGRSSAAGPAIMLPRVDEHTLGQLMQMLVLATLVAERA